MTEIRQKPRRHQSRRHRLLKWTGVALAAVVILSCLGLALFKWRFRHITTKEAMESLRAGVAARHAPHPAVRFLELRYGPLDDPANRQKAFLHFFDRGQVELMGVLVDHMNPGERRTNIADMAKWISDYRTGMTASEREALGRVLDSEAGFGRIREARQQYLSRDVGYRSATAPVIAELMMTLDHVRKR